MFVFCFMNVEYDNEIKYIFYNIFIVFCFIMNNKRSVY